jgi:hypothetical protein
MCCGRISPCCGWCHDVPGECAGQCCESIKKRKKWRVVKEEDGEWARVLNVHGNMLVPARDAQVAKNPRHKTQTQVMTPSTHPSTQVFKKFLLFNQKSLIFPYKSFLT